MTETKDKKTVLVTGGAGFVGSHLCERLVKEGYAVISLDNYFSGSVENHVEGVDYREGHTKNITMLIPEKVDLIYHLGEYSRVAPSLKEPGLVWDLNMVGTLAVLEYWRGRGCKLVYAGSSTKFADDGRDTAGRDRAPYNWSKAANSELIHNYGRWYGVPYSIAYFYNVYGPGERSSEHGGGYCTVVEAFRQCAIKSEPCTIYGAGEQVRAYTHVLDTVSGLIAIAQLGVADEYAISAMEEYTLNQLAGMFKIDKNFEPATVSTRSTGAEDTSKLEALGWEQKHTLSEYIASCKK